MPKQNALPVKILRPSLDDIDRKTVLRGIVANESLTELHTDSYQRESLPASTRRHIERALNMNRQLPDIELGMRGDRFQVDHEGAVLLLDPVFIIDGQQRRNTIVEYLDRFPEETCRLGAIVHFNTDVKWERERFHDLNSNQVKVAPSVLLRNIKDENQALATLYGLSKNTKEFALYGRVCWTQNMGRGELITAVTHAQTALRLHSHLAAVLSDGVKNIPIMTARLLERTGLPTFRTNVIAFWETIDFAWGIRSVQYRQSACYLRTSFLSVLARIMSDHIDFWAQPNEIKLNVPYELKTKLRKFPVNDPEVVRLAGSSGKAREALYFMLIQHLNSGKRTKRLTPRRATVQFDSDEDDVERMAS